MIKIPLFKPFYGEEEREAVAKVLESGWSGWGPRVADLENEMRRLLGVRYFIATNSCTSALHLCVRFWKEQHLGKRLECITTPLTFASTAAVALWEGIPVSFCDVRPDTLCLDVNEVFRRVRRHPEHKKLIIPVLYGGYNDRTPWLGMGEDVIFDCAHIAGDWDARGKVSCWSFHAVKCISAGEGGGIATDDSALAEWASRRRWLGIDKSTVGRSSGGYLWDYKIDSLGYKYNFSDMNAALALVQLGKLNSMQRRRQLSALRYYENLRQIPEVTLPPQSVMDGNSWHLFPIRAASRDSLMEFLSLNGVSTGVHYKPLYLHPAFSNCEHHRCPNTNSVWPTLVSLPMFPGLTPDDVDYVCEQVWQFFGHGSLIG